MLYDFADAPQARSERSTASATTGATGSNGQAPGAACSTGGSSDSVEAPGVEGGRDVENAMEMAAFRAGPNSRRDESGPEVDGYGAVSGPPGPIVSADQDALRNAQHVLADQVRALMLAGEFDAARALVETAARIATPAQGGENVAPVVDLNEHRRDTTRK